jgi:hypothetical protein
MFRKIFEPKRVDVRKDGGELHDVEILNLCSSLE